MATSKDTASVEERFLGITDLQSLNEARALAPEEVEARLEVLFDLLKDPSNLVQTLPELAGICEALIERLGTSECTAHPGNSVSISKDLRGLAVEATYELEGLTQAIVGMLPTPCAETSLYAVRGMALRAEQLTGVLMSVVGDTENCDLVDLERSAFGPLEASKRAAIRATAVVEH